MNTQIDNAIVHPNSISLLLVDKEGHKLWLNLPLPVRADRANVEDRLLSCGVEVSHSATV